MKKLLYIQASPRVERSYSRAIADAFIETYKKNNPDDKIVTLDLFKMELPAFDGLTIQAKYSIMHGQEHSQEEKKAWNAVERIIEEFKSADKYMFAVPMWNFGIPYRLKQYFDVIAQPGYTFSFSPEEGYKGLVTGKPAVVVYSRGGEYAEGSETAAYDQQTKYMGQILGFIGLTDIHPIIVEPTLASGPDTADEAKKQALAKAKTIGSNF
ncbi:FMN-dependent NADH-azoreductase [Verrucomicrobiota bacterium]